MDFLVPGDHANLVRIELSLNLPQELCKIIEYCPKTEPQTFGQIDFNTFSTNQTLIMRLGETDWGKMSVMTVGTFQVFEENITLTCVLQVEPHVFLRTWIFFPLSKQFLSLWRTDMQGVFV